MSPSVASPEAHALRCELAADALRASGRLRLQVTGWSMLPAVRPGDVVIVERAGRGEVSRGDIVLLLRNRRLVLHRVVDSSREADLVTRGDAMPAVDGPVPSQECLGKAVLIFRDGQDIRLRPNLTAAERVIAALVRRSTLAARIFIRFHQRFRPAIAPTTSSDRVVSCQS
jgi:signal peptidase I